MAAEFDQYSDDYDHLSTDSVRTSFGGGGSEFFHQRKMELLLRFLKREAPPPSQMAWLDVGCGRGELLELGRSVFGARAGCDPSEGMIKARNLADDGELELRWQSSATEIPFEARRFDLVTAVCVYHHVAPEQRVQLTGEIRRVLKPGGIFAMIEHNPLNPVTRFVVSRVPLDADAQLLSARTARSISSTAGLKPFRTEYFLYFPKSVYEMVGRIENALDWFPLGGQYACYARNV